MTDVSYPHCNVCTSNTCNGGCAQPAPAATPLHFLRRLADRLDELHPGKIDTHLIPDYPGGPRLRASLADDDSEYLDIRIITIERNDIPMPAYQQVSPCVNLGIAYAQTTPAERVFAELRDRPYIPA